MIKPIFKIELPQDIEMDEFDKICNNLIKSDLAKEYHIILIKGNTTYIQCEIITASDIKLHLP